MTDELLIQQPESASNWLQPGKRLNHLIAIFTVRSKKSVYDELAERDRDIAEFDFVDLDEERVLMPGADNHPGVTSRLKVGNPAVVLGRITAIPSKKPMQKDALVLGEHGPGDAELLQAWWKASQNGGPVTAPASTSPAQTAQAQPAAPAAGTVPPAAPAPAPVASAGPAASAGPVAIVPAGPVTQAQPAPAPAVDLTKLPPETLELLMKAVQQTQ